MKHHIHKKEKKNNNTIIITAVVTLVLIIAIAYIKIHVPTTPLGNNSTTGVNKDVAAQFDGNKITNTELNKELDIMLFLQGIPASYSNQVNKLSFLNQTIIRDEVYLQAKDDGIDVSVQDAQNQFESAVQRSGTTIEKFKEAISNRSFSYDDLIAFNRKQLIITKFINESVLQNSQISDADVQSYYNTNKSEFYTPAQIRASHILVNSSEQATSIISQLDKGADFSELAKNYSIGPSGPKGGDLGFFSKGMMVPEFENAAFALQNIGNYTTTPVKTQFGYHIILLTGKKDAHQETFDEAKEKIKQTLFTQKQNELVNTYIDNLMKNADIKIYLKPETKTPSSGANSKIATSDKPNVELFVMAYCPYGTQIEKGILPVIDLLGDKINFELKFVNYAMHGEKEVNENLRQHCIQEEQNDKFISYLKCFLKNSDSPTCLKETNVDTDKLNACTTATDTKFSVTENLNNKQGPFPAFLINDADNKKYGVKGSPTLVINAQQANSARDAESLLQTICSAFTTPPSECNTTLSTTNPSPGFGYDASGSDSSAGGCGV